MIKLRSQKGPNMMKQWTVGDKKNLSIYTLPIINVVLKEEQENEINEQKKVRLKV